jgi:uncharacterized protein (TIGR00369 family)
MASADGDLRMGFWVLDRHCNGMGFLHGGMISAFSDSALARAVFATTQRWSVTIKLTLEFLDIVREGSWVEAQPEVTAVEDDVVFVRADLMSDGKTIARATAIFRKLRRRPSA